MLNKEWQKSNNWALKTSFTFVDLGHFCNKTFGNLANLAKALREGLVVNVGLLGMNLSTEVRAGENRGRRLEHDFVLLSLSEAVLHVDSDGRSASASIVLDDVSDSADALVAWVSDADGLTPLQATGGHFP